MKASEVLRRYAAGERDFHCVNLRGQSFKGKNLLGETLAMQIFEGLILLVRT